MRFDIKAVKGGGEVTDLELDAASDRDAIVQAQNLGYSVLSVRQRTASVAWLSFTPKRFHLLLFTQELRALLDAGLSLVESIETLNEKEQRPESRRVMERIILRLFEGQPLSAALQQFPDIFPPLYIATVRASEKTGDLEHALSRYVAYQSQADLVRKKMVNASIYPVLLVGVGGLVMLFLLGYVVPRFSQVYEAMGTELPLFSRLLLGVGHFIQVNSVALLIGVILLISGAVYSFSLPAVKRWLGNQLWKIPAIGERMRIYQLARFYRMLGMLLTGGTPVLHALGMVSGLLQEALREKMLLAASDIREGQPISRAMENNGLTTPVALRMLRVGESTGQMGGMMERIASFYEEEMAQAVERFTRMFEPVLMAFIGLVIGGVVILMYLPIFELAGSIK
jgi:general secretion pathway protein F